MKKIMLIYPPGENYQRSEERCQINIEASVSNSVRACNDLGYVAGVLQCQNFAIFFKDYQSEKLSFSDFEYDLKKFNPDFIFISITNGSIYSDIKFVEKIKKILPEVCVIFKGALFFNPDEELFKCADFSNVDYTIGAEAEFIILDLLNAHISDKSKLSLIQGISYINNGNRVINKCLNFNENLDKLPFPARNLMNNDLYLNPATNKKMATISVSRGCPSSCTYCVTPFISGKNVRFRSPASILDEIKECVEKYGIYDFFFKADTFTINKSWVMEICNLIINSKLNEKINWVANSRVNTLDVEMLLSMKNAGCSLIALGIESGSDESLIKMKKNATVEQCKIAVALLKKLNFKIFGFYLIGFPWEKFEHLKETEKLIFELDTDFMELSVVTPFKGSELYSVISSHFGENFQILGKDSFKNLTTGTEFLSKDDLIKFRKRVILKYHLRPSFLIKKLFSKDITFSLLKNYILYGIRLLKNVFGN